MAFKKDDRVRVYTDNDTDDALGTIEEIFPKVDDPWAEQLYQVRMDNNDLFSVTVQEAGLRPVSEG